MLTLDGRHRVPLPRIVAAPAGAMEATANPATITTVATTRWLVTPFPFRSKIPTEIRAPLARRFS